MKKKGFTPDWTAIAIVIFGGISLYWQWEQHKAWKEDRKRLQPNA